MESNENNFAERRDWLFGVVKWGIGGTVCSVFFVLASVRADIQWLKYICVPLLFLLYFQFLPGIVIASIFVHREDAAIIAGIILSLLVILLISYKASFAKTRGGRLKVFFSIYLSYLLVFAGIVYFSRFPGNMFRIFEGLRKMPI